MHEVSKWMGTRREVMAAKAKDDSGGRGENGNGYRKKLKKGKC